MGFWKIFGAVAITVIEYIVIISIFSQGVVLLYRLDHPSPCELGEIHAEDNAALTYSSLKIEISLIEIEHTIEAAIAKVPLGNCIKSCKQDWSCTPNLKSCYKYCLNCRFFPPVKPLNCITQNCTRYGF